ncbi:MAG: D-2-hydroxyacid dehydrogenase [Cohnella sp.]|nr:D-2-hydroxyacid dehydrogenase [Cohnella sp.]
MKILVAYDAKSEWPNVPADLEMTYCNDDRRSIEHAMTPDTEVLVTDVMPTDISACVGLRWLHLLSAGTDQLICHPLMKQELKVSNSAGICAVHMAEFVVGQLLRHRKRFDALAELSWSKVWPDRVAYSRPSLRGQHALIIGYGGVGRETARLLTAFGMTVTAIQTAVARQHYSGCMPFEGIGDPDGIIPRNIVTTAELSSVLPEADVVILAVPLTPATHHLMNREAFARMKRDAVLINVSRGGVVDTASLLEALATETFDHAFLDVFEIEPLPADSVLWRHPRITVTPHMSGVMPDAWQQQQELFLLNVDHYRNNKTLINELDRSRFA